MASGHTDTKTINQRRPLTPGMRDLLASVCAASGGYLVNGFSSEGDKSRMRALADRKYVTLLADGKNLWVATEEGRAANG